MISEQAEKAYYRDISLEWKNKAGIKDHMNKLHQLSDRKSWSNYYEPQTGISYPFFTPERKQFKLKDLFKIFIP